MMPRAIPQEHNGIHYRSRTEARWGEFWTIAGVPFEYEPEGYDLDGDWYVPDFRVNGAVFVEVKPGKLTERERRVATSLADATGIIVVAAMGNPGHATLRAFHPGGSSGSAFIVDEYKSERGAWVAEFANGGGWALPLSGGLVNCAAHGDEHPLLAVAGRLQFGKPVVTEPDPRGFIALSDVAVSVLKKLQRGG